MNKLLQAIQLIQQAAIGLQPGTPLFKEANRAVGMLSKHLPQGAPTTGVQLTGMRDLLRQIMQNSFLPQIMKQMSQAGGGGGQGGPGPQQPPMPSTPLPGA
jgi:hypothetical protein